MEIFGYVCLALIGALWVRKLQVRLRLSRAKHPSIQGHAKISRRLARLVPFYEYGQEEAFASDDAPADIVLKRQRAFARLSQDSRTRAEQSVAFSRGLEGQLSDMQFTNAYRVPFQYRRLVRDQLHVPGVAIASDGVRLQNLDGDWAYDLGGSYGVNLMGYDVYKQCIERGTRRVQDLGPVLGPYHPLIAENVAWLCELSGMDQVSFHMSGTEAVMQAVGLARYHTRRSHLVLFCGAYHGWWDGVQPGVGGQRRSDDIYMLKENSADTLRVLETRHDIACVLINPLQSLHLNRGASSDAMLIASARDVEFERDAYRRWLADLRDVCTRRGIVMIMDEVFLGFRLGPGGAQEYFSVQADMVTYGKTVGGGLPVGVLCGKAKLMQRYREEAPTDICFARGTFNSHPYVMAAMNEFLQIALSPEFAAESQRALGVWDTRAAEFNRQCRLARLPLRVHNFASVWVLTYTQPSRFNWMLQYYLRAEGLALSWIGTARFIFSHNYTDADFAEVMRRFLVAAQRMESDGWWYVPEGQTDQSIKQRVMRELLHQRFNRFWPRSAVRQHKALDPSTLP
ncbi:MAG: aminotransferase class III-fold pyridoxal phosphate-dependent enzyme [Pseudomonadota bacterium]